MQKAIKTFERSVINSIKVK